MFKQLMENHIENTIQALQQDMEQLKPERITITFATQTVTYPNNNIKRDLKLAILQHLAVYPSDTELELTEYNIYGEKND